MARTTQSIYNEMVAEAINQATISNNTDALAMFSNTSKTAIWRLLFWIKAFAISMLEKLFDAHVVAVDANILAQVPPTLDWHKTKIKAFQFGFPLIAETSVFDNTGYTSQQIEDSKIIAYAAVGEATIDSKRVVLYKIAKLSGSELVPLSTTELNAFKVYIERYRPGGVDIVVYNKVADLIRTTVNVIYNPLLLDNTGLRTDGSGYPVKEAAQLYPINLEFDGEFVTAGFVDAMQAAVGVSNRKVQIVSIERKTEAGTWQSVGISFTPEAGYCKFETNGLTINYTADV